MREDGSARPQRIGHRGAPREYPENTLPSFARALELGADGIELDVHSTRDGAIVVHHDHVPRAATADRRLAGRPIAELTLDQLRRFSVAPDVGIPMLSEVLSLVGDAAIVYVELKGVGIERQVIDVIRQANARCALHSFDHGAIARARVIAPELRRGVLFDRRTPDPGAAMDAAGALDAWPEWPLVDPDFIESVRRVGGSVIAWTVNDVGVARRLTAMGVDGLCTDDVRLLAYPSA
jgi:glycerophosphoryl diester phosphodiesterase